MAGDMKYKGGERITRLCRPSHDTREEIATPNLYRSVNARGEMTFIAGFFDFEITPHALLRHPCPVPLP